VAAQSENPFVAEAIMPDAPEARTTVLPYVDVSPAAPVPAEWADYEAMELVGEGGMGVVYRARHRTLHRFEAIKVVRAGRFAGPRDLERFRFEAEATAGLDHPNIVSVYRVGEVDGLPFFAMKWVDGGDLTGRALALRADPAALAATLAKVARAVEHAHRRGILHRDLKPSNILLDATGEPHVTDFGLAKQVADTNTPRHGLTATGQAVGTPMYMAPEQARGAKDLTTGVDVYGLGAILYELLTGRPPFTGMTMPEVIRRVANDPPAPPRALDPAIDKDLEAICLKCLEKSPADRYPSAEALADDLDRRAAGKPVSVRPAGVRAWLGTVLARRPDSFEGYVWEIKVWFGVIMAVAQLAVFGLVQAEAAVGWVWATYLTAWAAGAVALYEFMARRFTRLPETEKDSMLIAVGHILAHVVLATAYVPFTGPAAQALAVYPAQAVVSGLALFVVGTTHWGRFFWIGLGVMAVAPVLALWPAAAPLVYGAAVAAAMWHWAYAVKVTFGRREEEAFTAEGAE
jgi:serine/threonine-protein kinase